MGDRVRPYLFYDTATSICSQCYRRADAKIVFQDEQVYLLKRCPKHGFERDHSDQRDDRLSAPRLLKELARRWRYQGTSGLLRGAQRFGFLAMVLRRASVDIDIDKGEIPF